MTEFNIAAVTDDDFQSRVIEADAPVLVDFWAPWCAPCRQLAPILDEIAREQRDRLTVLKLDADANPATLAHYGISGLPTLVLWAGGQTAVTIVGVRPKNVIMKALEPHLN